MLRTIRFPHNPKPTPRPTPRPKTLLGLRYAIADILKKHTNLCQEPRTEAIIQSQINILLLNLFCVGCFRGPGQPYAVIRGINYPSEQTARRDAHVFEQTEIANAKVGVYTRKRLLQYEVYDDSSRTFKIFKYKHTEPYPRQLNLTFFDHTGTRCIDLLEIFREETE